MLASETEERGSGLDARKQRDYAARELVQVVIGVLALHREPDLEREVIDELVRSVKGCLASMGRCARAR